MLVPKGLEDGAFFLDERYERFKIVFQKFLRRFLLQGSEIQPVSI